MGKFVSNVLGENGLASIFFLGEKRICIWNFKNIKAT